MIIIDNTILVIEGVRHWFWARAILRQQVRGDKVLHHAKQVQKVCKFICNGRTDEKVLCRGRFRVCKPKVFGQGCKRKVITIDILIISLVGILVSLS